MDWCVVDITIAISSIDLLMLYSFDKVFITVFNFIQGFNVKMEHVLELGIV